MNIKTSFKVLDIGAGKYKKQNSFGLDCNPELVDLYLPDSFALHDLSKPFPFDDGIFEEVYAGHILEHFPDPLVIIKEAHRVLKEGGFFIAVYPVDDGVDTQPFVPNKDCGHRINMGENWVEENVDKDMFDILDKEIYMQPDTIHRGETIEMKICKVVMVKKYIDRTEDLKENE